MRRVRTLLIITLILLLLTGCDSAVPPETTIPPETTVPEETTQPVEITEAPVPETTIPPTTEPVVREIDPLYLEMVEAGFEMIQGDPYQSWSEWHFSPHPSRYQYVGDDNTIVFPSASITLTLPEEWKDQLTVTTNRYDDPPYGRMIYIHSSRVLETTIEYYLQDRPSSTRETMDMPYYDYVLLIQAFPRVSHDNMVPEQDPYHPRIGIYLGEDEHYYYFAYLPGSFEDIGRINIMAEMIAHIGEEAYNALVGDLVLDYDMVREMVTIRDETTGE